MRHSDSRAALTDEVARFQAEVRRLALAVVYEVVRQEIDRKQAKRPPARRGAGASARADAAESQAPARTRKQPAARAREQPAPPAQEPPPPPPATTQEPQTAPATQEPPAAGAAQDSSATAPAADGKREQWTRDSIISELASWMSSGTTIDAAFLTRYGPPGLVAATRRVFGRFDAALNVAGLHVSKLYPDGPPTRPGAPASLAAFQVRRARRR